MCLAMAVGCRTDDPQHERAMAALDAYSWDLDLSQGDLAGLESEVILLGDGARREHLVERVETLEDEVAGVRGAIVLLRGDPGLRDLRQRCEERLASLREDVAQLRLDLITAK